MFDDLDDDQPFAPGSDFRAGVDRRATALRRRGAVLRAAAAVAVFALVAGGIALTLRDDDTESLDVIAPSSTTTDASTTTSPASTSTSAVTGELPPRVVLTWHGVLGAWLDGRWVGDDDAVELIHPGERYQVVKLTERLGFATGSEPGGGCSPSGSDYNVRLSPPLADPAQVDIPQPEPVAVSGPGELFPRPVVILEDDRPYAAPMAAALRAEGVAADADQIHIRQLLRADLDGDGADEVLIVAERRHDPAGTDARLGDYSAVAVRRIVDGQVRTELLEHSAASDMGGGPEAMAFLNLFAIDTVADLNGDGSLEVVVQARYYEGGAATLYAPGPGGLAQVGSVGCGA